ncbi:class I SAM-dependent RNA methyltransferase [Candidatus Saccharibacteria bacterium]|nr:class I SAM-dependent RNA methyltransferase [Candidatus Saccharibacteria bacterium]
MNITIEKLVPGGQGIGVDENGKKGFFWNALPGEIVTKYRITKNKSHYFEAIAEEIENPSAHRVIPKDSCYLSTSPWQIMDYDFELAQKAELLKEQFRQAEISLEQCFVGSSTTTGVEDRELARNDGPSDRCPQNTVQTDNKGYHYRNKMEYSLYWDNEKQKIFLAFHERGSHRKIPITSSSIERPEIYEKAQAIIDNLNANHEEARKYQSLLLRCNQKGEVSGGLYENKKPHEVFPNLTDDILGYAYSYSPNGFFQINLPVYEMALLEIKKHIKTKKVLDLYAGVGTIGLSVARGHELTLVECNKFAYTELEKNCAKQNTVRAILRNSEDALEFVAPDQTVIVDPPRAGCDKKLLDKFINIQPETIIYLSCNPATQARDVKILLDSGKYQISSVVPFNFFPRTPHLENLVVLRAIMKE